MSTWQGQFHGHLHVTTLCSHPSQSWVPWGQSRGSSSCVGSGCHLLHLCVWHLASSPRSVSTWVKNKETHLSGRLLAIIKQEFPWKLTWECGDICQLLGIYLAPAPSPEPSTFLFLSLRTHMPNAYAPAGSGPFQWRTR